MSNSLGNDQIQVHIEQGTSAIKYFLYTYNDTEQKLKWSPISYSIAKVAFYESMMRVPEEYREWIATPRVKRAERKLARPPTEAVLLFNFHHAVASIFYALRKHYPGITIQQVEDLNIDHDKFHTEIAEASGIMGGQKTVETFPADASSQHTKD